MRYQGRITTWKDDKGFGFITTNGSDTQIFVHINSFSNRQRRPTGNELVTYEIKVDSRGRRQAEAVAFVGKQVSQPAPLIQSNIPPLFACCFLVFVATSVFAGKLPKIVLVLYFFTSVIAFFAYAFDKEAARNNRWRTPENTLHLFALLGGWPGALAAQRLFRHKSKKTSFLTVFWATVFLNCCALGWLFSPFGSKTMRSIFHLL